MNQFLNEGGTVQFVAGFHPFGFVDFVQRHFLCVAELLIGVVDAGVKAVFTVQPFKLDPKLIFFCIHGFDAHGRDLVAFERLRFAELALENGAANQTFLPRQNVFRRLRFLELFFQ